MVEPQPLPSPATKHASITRKFGHAPVFSFLVLFAAGPVLAIIGKKLSGVNARPIVESLRRSIRAEHFLGLWQGDDLLKLVLDELGQVGGQKDLVVFLRSFEDDRYFWNLRGMYGMWVSEEEELSQAIAPLGPVVAIGRPGEMLQTPGAARMYVEDEQWQKEVANLVAEARLVVVRVGASAGLWWEIEHLVDHVPPERVLIFLAFPGRRRRRRAAYGAFRKRGLSVFPRGLPDEPGDALFIWFGADWTPHLLGERFTRMTRLLSLANHRARSPLYHEALLPVFRAFDVPQQRLRLGAADWLSVGMFFCLPLVCLAGAGVFVFVTVALFGAARWNDITAIVGSVGMLLMTLGMVGLSLWLIVFIWRVFK